MANAKIITCWSAVGSVGRTTIALAVAFELSQSGKKVLVIDADTYAPNMALQFGLNSHPAGLAAACRLVSQQRFDEAELNRLTVKISAGGNSIHMLTGLSSANRWAEVAPEIFDELTTFASNFFDFIVLDVAAQIEPNLFDHSAAVTRNAITRWAVGYSDFVLAISGSEPVAVSRFVAAYTDLAQLAPLGELITVVNQMKNSVLGRGAKQQVSQTISRLASTTVAIFIPSDATAADSALRFGHAINMGKRSSPARQALALLVATKLLASENQLDRRVAKLF